MIIQLEPELIEDLDNLRRSIINLLNRPDLLIDLVQDQLLINEIDGNELSEKDQNIISEFFGRL